MAEPGPNNRLDHHHHNRRLPAGKILRRSFAASVAALPSLVVAFLILLCFRSALLSSTLHLSSLPDRHPSLRHLLLRLSPSDPPPSSAASSSTLLRRRASRPQPPFLRFSARFAPNDDNDEGTFFSPSSFSSAGADLLSLNSSRLFSLPDSHTSPPFNIRVPDFVPSSPFVFSFPDSDDEGVNRDDGDVERDRISDLRILDLNREDVTAIACLLVLLSSVYVLTIFGFIITYTAALGVAFVSVASFHIRRPLPVAEAVVSGVRLGTRRLVGFVFLRWAARDALVQFLSMWFFAHVLDQGELFKLFVKVKLMPFSLSPVNPWSSGAPHEKTLAGFLFAWGTMDTLMSLVLAVVPWVVVMDHHLRRQGQEIIKEGFYLVALMPGQAVLIKLLETVILGDLGRWVAMLLGGRLCATVYQSAMEVYFMVVWLNFYFAARIKDGKLVGRRFGRRDLEECINGIR